jgi:galactitol-specific phosphotransferase system IIB component
MPSDQQERDDEQDWRMEAELQVPDTGGALHELIGRLRGPDVVKEIEARVSHDVVVTHDGKLLFAYAAGQATLASARSEIEQILAGDGIQASVRVSHWDDESEKWRQTDPPLTVEEQQSEDVAERDANAPETRTLVVSSGKMIRAEFEQSIREWADKLELQCAIVEHPHLLTTQVAFTVTGPKHKVEEFARGLRAEEWRTIRTETAVMASPL